MWRAGRLGHALEREALVKVNILLEEKRRSENSAQNAPEEEVVCAQAPESYQVASAGMPATRCLAQAAGRKLDPWQPGRQL